MTPRIIIRLTLCAAFLAAAITWVAKQYPPVLP